MMHILFLMMMVIGSGMYAGEQARISRTSYRSQSGKLSKRGKKRNQKFMPTLEQFARDKFPGPDVQLGQKSNKASNKTSAERRKRKKAWQESVLLEETGRPGSAEQCAATKVLLKANVNPDMKYLKECGVSFQGSPLRNASVAGNIELLTALLEAGADPNAPCLFSSKRGYGKELPIHGAARLRNEKTDFDGFYPEVIALLHAYGADINSGGETQELPFAPIHMIVLQRAQRGEDVDSRIARQIAALKVLMDCGADFEKKTFNGDTAIALATKRGNKSIAMLLENALERQNKNKFTDYSVAFQKDVKPGDKQFRRKAEKAAAKNRRLRKQLKNQCMQASSSQSGNDY